MSGSAGSGRPWPEDRGRRRVIRSVGQARPQVRADVSGVIVATETISVGGSATYRCLLTDGTGSIDLLFLGRSVIPGLGPASRCNATGMVATFRGRLAIWNPEYMLEPAQDSAQAQLAAKEAGADVYLTKPFAIGTLLSAMDTVLSAGRINC